ncbi:hypothetical protein LSAT2_005058 [Lamellibrachia satsuma]|nr:hypothetical protein LSAT2_005058 [Lamellibrachia satsuma]
MLTYCVISRLIPNIVQISASRPGWIQKKSASIQVDMYLIQQLASHPTTGISSNNWHLIQQLTSHPTTDISSNNCFLLTRWTLQLQSCPYRFTIYNQQKC